MKVSRNKKSNKKTRQNKEKYNSSKKVTKNNKTVSKSKITKYDKLKSKKVGKSNILKNGLSKNCKSMKVQKGMKKIKVNSLKIKSKIKKNDSLKSKTRKDNKRYSWLFEKKKNESVGDSNSENEKDITENKIKKKKKFVLFKKRKNNNKSKVVLSCFQNLGLSEKMCKSISTNLKYNKPTDIQKLCIPKIFSRKDVICVSKTGSGKSLVYLSTLIDILKEHSKYFGIRGLIILPTKELVIQIYKLAKKICCNFFNLNINIIIGGVSLVKQFDILKENLDILICTPGRMSFILEETKLSLEKVEILIIDEADRLLELNYYNDMNLIYKNLTNTSKQTILISATLPTNVENYFKLKLNNPDIAFVNSDNMISDQLDLHFLFCRSYEKYAVLLKLILIFKSKNLGKTMLFFCTKYHILFFSKILNYLKISHSVLYGNADTSFRFQQINNFTNDEKIQFLLVTDLASRGINITSVQNVINYNLPFSSKLFIHRIGRACRNNMKGYAISIVTYQDILYAYEICFFIGKKLKFFKNVEDSKKEKIENNLEDLNNESDGNKENNYNETDETSHHHFDEKGKNAIKVDNNISEHKEKDYNDINESKEKKKDNKKNCSDIIYLGALDNICDYVEYIENLKRFDSELVSLNKSILASYKIYFSMRPKVSKYVSTKCINKIKKMGGIYKLCLCYHPDLIYKNCFYNSDIINVNENNKNLNNPNDVDDIFSNLINFLKTNGKKEGKNDYVNNENKENIQKKNTTDSTILEMKDELKNKREFVLDNNNIIDINNKNEKNYSHNEVYSFLHNFQNNDNNKVKSISEEVKEKLNKLKEKSEKYKYSKNSFLPNDISDLTYSFALGLSDEEIDIENYEERDKNILLNSINEINNEKKKKKKLSKRALRKLSKEKSGINNIEISHKKKEEFSFDDILKKINEKKIKKDTNFNDLKTPGYDLPPDEEEEMNKQRFIKKNMWDKKKKKFVMTEIDTFQDKVIKGKDEQKKKSKNNMNTANIYQKWVKKTKNRIKKIGELEDDNYRRDNKKKSIININKNEIQKTENNDKENNLNMLKLMHPEITDALSKNIKLTKKQQRLYKKYITGKYVNSKEKGEKSSQLIAKEKKKMLQKKLKTDKKFRSKYLKIKKRKYEKKLQEKQNLKSARSRSLIIIKKKKIIK
ncbi:ATP-dependent RNA helicase DBP10, putative [Plasmodium gallinaceum]|uniref:ATP-dependent RNA helicase DBP10, putative n=1 Tax=Plasmodium gallinaceum TaxID=5849 RepID=A0A1J1GQC1_PLAGA|nr:ATP-dependent RNA helicase DBP10, putative [Plasmodium gallinaceum]CRG93495.1 ATP-dependent RNA helicase DBP10, putative [Plasmodium gallinaceum]